MIRSENLPTNPHTLVAVLHVLITIVGLSDPTMILPTDNRVYFDKAYFSFTSSLITLISPVIETPRGANSSWGHSFVIPYECPVDHLLT